jgi:hypothetical protein
MLSRSTCSAVASVAQIFRKNRHVTENAEDLWRLMQGDFIEMFKADNPRFDQNRFVIACLPE